MNSNPTRWLLAFDAGCARCRALSETVVEGCAGKLEVMPLAHPDVRRWRERSLGSPAPWTPTLIRVDGEDVRAWTGRSMAVPLVRWLGVRSTFRVVHALGQLRETAVEEPVADGSAMSRKRFLQFGAGVAVAAGIVLTGNMPAFARNGGAKAIAWVEANRDRLPQRYAEFAEYPMSFRRAIFSELAPDTQRRMWLDHIADFRAARPDLSKAQAAVVDRFRALAAEGCSFDSQPERDSAFDRTAREITVEAKAVFGHDTAHALLTTLGPVETAADRAKDPDGVLCPCSDQCHDYCGNSYYCKYGGCDFTRSCCFLWQYVCNGFCTR